MFSARHDASRNARTAKTPVLIVARQRAMKTRRIETAQIANITVARDLPDACRARLAALTCRRVRVSVGSDTLAIARLLAECQIVRIRLHIMDILWFVRISVGKIASIVQIKIIAKQTVCPRVHRFKFFAVDSPNVFKARAVFNDYVPLEYKKLCPYKKKSTTTILSLLSCLW
jgi:hypothetical protein